MSQPDLEEALTTLEEYRNKTDADKSTSAEVSNALFVVLTTLRNIQATMQSPVYPMVSYGTARVEAMLRGSEPAAGCALGNGCTCVFARQQLSCPEWKPRA